MDQGPFASEEYWKGKRFSGILEKLNHFRQHLWHKNSLRVNKVIHISKILSTWGKYFGIVCTGKDNLAKSVIEESGIDEGKIAECINCDANGIFFEHLTVSKKITVSKKN